MILHNIPAGFLDVAPELVVEVLSDDVSWKEMEQKIAEYLAFGVDTVWVVDSRMLAVRVYPRAGHPFVLQQHDAITAPQPAGFSCRVVDLLS